MLLENNLRAETLLLDHRSGIERPDLEPAPAGHLFFVQLRELKRVFIFLKDWKKSEE